MTKRKLFTNAACSTLGLIAQIAVSFLLAPIVLRALGDNRYGVWSFAESVLAYLMLFDLGVAAALVRFVPRFLANCDQSGVNRVFSASLAFFSIVASAAGLVAFLVLYLFADSFVRVPEALAGEVRLVLLAVVVNFIAVLPLSVFSAMLDGLNAFATKNIIRMAVLLARIPATLWVIRGETPLLSLILLLTISNLAESALHAIFVYRQMPGLRFVPRQVDRATLRMIRGFSVDSFLAMMAGRLSFSTDAFVIGSFLGAAAITPFAVALRLVDLSRSVLRSATTTLTPAISASEARGDLATVRGFFLHGTRLVLYGVLPIQAGLFILGRPFLSIWLGAEYGETAGPVLDVLAVILGFTIAQSVAARVLYGVGRIRMFARMALVEGVANLVLSLALVQPFGIVGVAWGTTIPHVGFCVFAVISACRYLKIGPRRYLATWTVPTMLTIIPAALWLMRLASATPRTWAEFSVTGLVGVVPYLIIVAVIEFQSRISRTLLTLRRISMAAVHYQAER